MTQNEYHQKLKDIVIGLGLHVTEDGYITTSAENGVMITSPNGLPFVLPTTVHLNTINNPGTATPAKVIFSPLTEDAIKGESNTLLKIKSIVAKNMSKGIYAAGAMLLTLATNLEFQQKSTNLAGLRFLESLDGTKVDDTTIKNWNSLYKNSIADQVDFIKIFIKKNTKIGDTQYHSVVSLSSPFLDKLLEVMDTKDPVVFGVKLRKKDISVYISILYHILPEIKNDTKVILFGSNNPEAPSYSAVMTAYFKSISNTNSVLQDMSNIPGTEHMKDLGYIKLEPYLTLDNIAQDPITYASIVKLSGGQVTPPAVQQQELYRSTDKLPVPTVDNYMTAHEVRSLENKNTAPLTSNQDAISKLLGRNINTTPGVVTVKTIEDQQREQMIMAQRNAMFGQNQNIFQQNNTGGFGNMGLQQQSYGFNSQNIFQQPTTTNMFQQPVMVNNTGNNRMIY